MGLGEKLKGTLGDTVKFVAENLFTWLTQPTMDAVKQSLALESLNEKMFTTPEVKDFVKALKKEWSESPDTLGEIAENFLGVISGKVAKVQLEGIIHGQITDDMTHTNALFNHIAIVTDITLLSNVVDIILDFKSLGAWDNVGEQLRQYMSYSGMAQVTQFGYGMIFSSAVSPLVIKEVNRKTTPTIFSEGVATGMRFRGILDEGGYMSNMASLGYSPQRAEQFYRNSWFYPLPTDFIRFSVREVFKAEIVEKYGYDKDFPIDEKIPVALQPEWVKEVSGGKDITLGDAVKLASLDPEILKWYWRAHWDLPSPTMGYEMLHRRIIDMNELETLLRVSDFAPYWIPHMVAMSYSPLTRVDARRMFEMGVLSDEDFKSAMLDLGYSDGNADLMLQWATNLKMNPEKDLTRSMIENAFKKGLKTREWTITALEGLGYDSDESELILALIEAQSEAETQDEAIEILVRLYIRNMITEEVFTKNIEELGLTEIHMGRVVDHVESERAKRLRLPTKADVTKWFTQELITEGDFTVRMRALGYRTDDITLFILSITEGKEVTP